MAYFRKGADNQGAVANRRYTTDKRVVAKRVIEALNTRIDADPNLTDVDTATLLHFLKAVMPKEQQGTIDHVITYKSNIPNTLEYNDIIEIDHDDSGCVEDGQVSDG
jgi:hypothetical protein